MPIALTPAHQALHRLSRHNKLSLEESGECGCFHCCRLFPPGRVKAWVDSGTTALCPFCHVDAVLPDRSLDRPLTHELLGSMRQVYFEAPVSKATPVGMVPSQELSANERNDRLVSLYNRLSVSQLWTDAKLKALLHMAFPWQQAWGLGLGWSVLAMAPLVYPWILAHAEGWGGLFVMTAIAGSSFLGFMTARCWPLFSSWVQAKKALSRGQLDHEALGAWLGGGRNANYTPVVPTDFYHRQAEDWARAVPELAFVWNEWKAACVPIRRVNVSLFLRAAREHVGEQGPYAPGEPL